MSITIQASPSGEVGVNDSLWHIASSTNSGSSNFKYVFDMYVNGVQLTRIKTFPDPTTLRGYLDASDIVRSQFTYEWLQWDEVANDNLILDSPNASGEISLTYQVRYGEEVSGVLTTNLASGNTTVYNFVDTAFKRRVSRLQGRLFSPLSDRDIQHVYIPLSGDLLIPYYGNTDISVEDDLGNSYPIIASATDTFNQLNISPKAINKTIGGTPRITAANKYYDVILEAAIIRVHFICDSRYTPYQLHFINHYGMWETATFELASKLTMDVEKQNYMRRPYTLGNSAANYFESGNLYRQSKLTHDSRRKYKYKLTMNAPTDKDYLWLEQLVASPKVVFAYDGYYYPVTLMANNYDFRQFMTDKLQPFEVEFELEYNPKGFAR